ncbi:effector binding domain-containing protein [Heyndrickxia oleronia]|uniref:zinc ribbon domain-containing protein n=1 Tax=Heyndrickxia oleronia TaxID=38875 RepID=UPI00203C1796|nr:zinc ribbon domain-containing protein [Heyndrickxia oleronia]MCM3240114.1 effector binding domain-containing protein [Heyndrickxia oleronia]
MNQVFCQSCGMPMKESSVFGTELTGEKNKEFCLYCYENGEFKQPNMTMEEMIQFCIPFMVEEGIKENEALTILQKSMPYLKRWRKSEPISEPKIVLKDGFTFMGINTRTMNAIEVTPEGVIPSMWEKYYTGEIAAQIPNQVNPQHTIALYSNYESDVSSEYDFSIGTEVEEPNQSSNDFVIKTIPASNYAVFTTNQGKFTEIVPMAWIDIWKWFETSGVERTYTGDFELYDERCVDPDQAVVDIYIAIK